MHTPGRYEDHQHVESARFRHRERDHSHIRALRARPPRDGLVARMLARFRIGASTRRPVVLTHDFHELRGAVCRLANGDTGRIAVHRAEGVWMAICEPQRDGPDPLAG